MRYDHVVVATKAADTTSSGIERLLMDIDENGQKRIASESPTSSSSSTIYQLREFIESLTGECADGRVLIRRNDENNYWR